jgi:hypothetical protein
MTNTGYKVLGGGADFSTLFEPLYSTPISYNTNYKTAVNDDLTDIFQPFVNGGSQVTVTGYKDISGNDLNTTFMKKRTDYIAFPTTTSSPSYYLDQVQGSCIWGQYAIMVWNGFQSGSNGGLTSGFYYSSNFGASFTKSTTAGTTAKLGRYCAIWRNYAFASSDVDLWRSTNYGVTWTIVGSGGFGASRPIAILNNMVITSTGSTLYVSNDYGVTWSALGGSNPTGYFPGVSITKNANSSTTFTAVICSSTQSFRCINFTGTANDVFITSTTNATTGYNYLRSSGSVCVAGGDNGISYSLDYGDNWVASNVTARLLGLGFSQNIGLALGFLNNIYYISRDFGKTWTTYTFSGSVQLFAACIDNGHAFMVQYLISNNTNYVVYGLIS